MSESARQALVGLTFRRSAFGITNDGLAVSKSDFDPDQIDPSRIKFASQDGVEQFELLARSRGVPRMVLQGSRGPGC